MAWRDFVPPGRSLPDEPGDGDVFFGVAPITPDDERRPGDARPCRCGSAVVPSPGGGLVRQPGRLGRSYVQAGSRQYCELCGVYGQDRAVRTIRSDPASRVYEEKVRGERE